VKPFQSAQPWARWAIACCIAVHFHEKDTWMQPRPWAWPRALGTNHRFRDGALKASLVVLRVVVATFGRFVMFYFSFLREKGYLLHINWVLWLSPFLFDRKVHGTSIDRQLQEPRKVPYPGKRFCFLSRSLIKVSFCQFVSEIEMKRLFSLNSDTELTCRSVLFEGGQHAAVR